MVRTFKRPLKPILLVVSIALAPLASAAETLRDAMIGAYRHSGLLEQNRALLRAADEDVALAVAALRPILNWSANLTQVDTASRQSSGLPTFNSNGAELSAAIVAELLLWDNGRSQLAVEAAKETVLATRERLVSVEQQILLRAVSAYFGVRREAENVALRENNLRLIREELRAAQDRFEVGEVTRTDVAQAEARLAEARSGLSFSRGQLAQARAEYANVVGRQPGPLAAPGRLPGIAAGVEQAQARAVRNHPDLRSAQHQVAAAELNVKRAQRSTSPTVSLTGSLSNTNSLDSGRFSESARVGLEVSGPIYQGGGLAATTRAAIANRDAQRAGLHDVRHNIRQNVANAYAQYVVANAQLDATRERIRAARVAFDGVREEATLGARTTLDVLDAEQALLDAQAAQISAQADQYIAAYSVLAASGRLTATALGLGIRQYDPRAYYNLVKDAPTSRSEQGRKLDKVLKSLQKD